MHCLHCKDLKTAVLLATTVHSIDIVSEYRCCTCRTILITRQEITSCIKQKKNIVGFIPLPDEDVIANLRPGLDRFPVDDEHHVPHENA